MPSFETLPFKATLMQNKTTGYCILEVENVDLGYLQHIWSGDPNGKIKATLVKPNGTTIEKTNSFEVGLVNTAPQQIKVLILPEDLDFTGKLKIFPEFAAGDSWLQGLPVDMEVIDDPIPNL